MDPEKQDKKEDELDSNKLLKTGKDLFGKAKNTFKMIKRVIAAITALPIIIKLLVIFIAIAAVITFFSSILDWFQSNTVADVASMNVINSEVSIENAGGSEGYYFKINNEILDKYMEDSFYADQEDYRVDELPTNEDYEEEEEPEDEDEKQDEDKEEYDEENKEKTELSLEDWFKVKDFKEYFIKMIRAEIASAYPKLGNYEGTNPDGQGNKRDNDNDYVAQGVVKIHRQKMKEDGTVEEEIELTYLPREELKALIDANDLKALDHFSFDANTGLIYYATYVEVVVTVDGVETSREYQLNEDNASYKNLTSMCSMPYNFLFSLLQESKNPNYLMRVIDLLLKKSEVILMIQDQLNITTQTEINRQVQRTDSTQATGYTERYRGRDGEEEEVSYWSYGATTSEYEFPAGATQTIVTTTYRNTACVYVKKAETWCMDFEQGVTLNVKEEEGEAVETPHDDGEFAGLTYTLVSSNKGSMPSPSEGASFTIIEIYLSEELLNHTTKLDTKDYTWQTNVLVEKRINYERFLGLWKNDKGEYYEDCQFDPNGKDVKYEKADDERKLEVVVDNIADAQGQTINDLIDLLALHENTQTHEQLMKYYWNIYYGEEIYEVDLGELLDLFETESFTSISGGSIYGSSVEEKVWFALIDAGFSEYAAAGAMGNIWKESGFLTNNLQNTYETKLGMNDTEYTTKVDDGTYTNFVGDSAGYGLCQWTTSGRKKGLLDYTKGKNVSISDANSQIEYMLAELGIQNGASGLATYNLLTNHGYCADDWINAESVEEATRAFCWSFERPGDPDLVARIGQAEKYYAQFHGKTKPEFGGDTVTVGSYVFPHYLQKNYSGSYGTSTISAAGCGPTSLAMILAGLLRDNTIDPISVVENIKANWPSGSYYVSGVGSSHCIFRSDFLFKYYGVTSQVYPSQAQALQALEDGYPVLGGEDGHFLALIPVSEELKAQGYKFYIMDSARGHDGPYKSVADANKVVRGYLRFNAIIKP